MSDAVALDYALSIIQAYQGEIRERGLDREGFCQGSIFTGAISRICQTRIVEPPAPDDQDYTVVFHGYRHWSIREGLHVTAGEDRPGVFVRATTPVTALEKALKLREAAYERWGQPESVEVPS